jgi:hypothetical protein
MEFDDAVEFMFYNVVGAWVGDETPVFIKFMEKIEDIVDEEHGN